MTIEDIFDSGEENYSKQHFEIGPQKELFEIAVNAPKNDRASLLVNEEALDRGIYARLTDVGVDEEPRGVLFINTKTNNNYIKFIPWGTHTVIEIESTRLLEDLSIGNGKMRNINSIFMRAAMLSLANEYLFIHSAAVKYKNNIYLIHSGQSGTGKSKIVRKILEENPEVELISDSYVIAQVSKDAVKLFPQRYPKSEINVKINDPNYLEKWMKTIDSPIKLDKDTKVYSFSIQYNEGLTEERVLEDVDSEENIIHAANFGLNFNFLDLDGHVEFRDTRDTYLNGLGYNRRIAQLQKSITNSFVYNGSGKQLDKILNPKPNQLRLNGL